MKLRLIPLVIAAVVMVLGSLTGCSGTPGVEVTETISVADSPQMTTSPEIRDFETIGVTDLPNVQASLMINVTETIGVTDTPTILLPIDIRIVETIGVTDTPTVQTSQQQSLPTINYFTASPTTIYRGQSSTLSWSVSNASSVIIDQNIGQAAPTGTRVVSPALKTTYTLKATNQAGSVTASVTVTVLIRLF